MILLTRMEHHANIVPWQLVAQRTGARIKVADIREDGTLDLDALFAAMTAGREAARRDPRRTCWAPSTRCARSAARRAGAASSPWSTAPQAMPHMPVDIAAVGCDFYAFTGHKMCGPTGTGALWARANT